MGYVPQSNRIYFFRENYGSRIDRIYAADLKEHFKSISVKPISFSDHNCVIGEVDVNCNIGIGRYYWKLNTKLLELNGIEQDFSVVWNRMLQYKNRYHNIIDWWELCVKVGIKQVLKKKGLEESRLKHGLVRYLESKLKKLYINIHVNDTLDMIEVNRLKDKINRIKDNILEGVKIRARVKEQIDGERPTPTLFGKLSASKSKPLITEVKLEHSFNNFPTNTILTDQNNISKYISSYFEGVYSKKETDTEKQDWFLSFKQRSITDSDNDMLTSEIGEEEILLILNYFCKNKSPGIYGIPIEFYLKFFYTD